MVIGVPYFTMKNSLTQCYMDIHEMVNVEYCNDKHDIFILKIDGLYVFRILNENYKTLKIGKIMQKTKNIFVPFIIPMKI